MPVEDTILKILEARARGLDDRSTANEVGLSIFITTRYEKITKRTIKDAISNGALTLDEIARKVRLPRVVVDRFMSHYGISLPVPQPAAPEEKKKTVNWSLYREEQIRSAISSGAKNLDEIAQRAGLAPGTVRGYARRSGIKLPRAEIAERERRRAQIAKRENRRLSRVEQIRGAVSSGAKDLDEICRQVGLAPGTVRSFAYQNGIKLPSWRTAKRKGKIARIQEAIDDGVASVSDISRRLGLNRSTILYCAKIDGFPLAKKIRANRLANKIRQAVAGGAASVSDISRRISLSESTILYFAKKKGIELPSLMKARAEQIRKAVAEGAIGTTAISRRTGLSSSVILAFAKKSNLNIPIGVKAKHIAQREAVQKALQEGVKSLEELCRRIGYKPAGFRLFCERNDISLPDDLVPYRFKPDIDRLVDEGQSLETIASIVDMGRESVRVYLLVSGQYVMWKEARERRETESDELHSIHTSLVSLLTAKWVNLVRNQSWPYQMAIDYMTNHPGNRLPLSKLVALFGRYETAMNQGEKLSLKELSKGLGIWYSHTSQILDNAGLEPMYGTNVRSSPASPEKVSAIKRGYKLGMPGTDIAYFLKLHARVVSYRNRKGKKPKSVVLGWVVEKGTHPQPLNYSLASQIYEAKDAGFNKEETVELLDTDMAMVAFALSNRRAFEPKIIKKLKVLYNSDSVNKPYRSS